VIAGTSSLPTSTSGRLSKTRKLKLQKSFSATDAVNAERSRIAAIHALPEGKGQEALATTLALTTAMTVDQVKAKLAAETSALWSAVLRTKGMVEA
jgi:hypothetical protein